MSGKRNEGRKSVVVVGGGAAGVNIARPLSAELDEAQYNLFLVNPLPYRIVLPATLRMTVSDVDNLATTALVPYDKIFHGGRGTFIQDSVEGIHQKAGETTGFLTLAGGEKLPYDILILAPGLSWQDPLAFPSKAEDVATYVASSRERFARARSYLLVGGGAVGCELAGELKDIWPERDVTIVHAKPLLFNDAYPNKFRRAMAKGLTARGVKLHLGDVVENPVPAGCTVVVTRTGLTLSAGLILRTTGASHPNTAFIKSLDADVLTPAGFVKVKPTLQLFNYPNIFAAGDAIEWKEQKQALKCYAHAKVVTKNVARYNKAVPLKNYATGFEAIIVTNGKRGGASYFDVLWGILLGKWFTSMAKSKSLLVPLFRKESGFV
ncbi:FAD/NAD(P)-binding domain-containing protein [Mycena haematopus]|nr:FAD/NAD(P)-binding domain-containing protein [Mycena haematopus]